MTPGYPVRAQPPPVVVVGLDCITGLQTARIFHGRGVRVTGVVERPSHFAARTRACERIVTAPPSGGALVARLLQLGSELPERAVLIPCTDRAVAAIADARDQLSERYFVPLSDRTTVLTLLDKVRFEEWAAPRGYPIPRTMVLQTRTDAEHASDVLRFPAVLKPAVKTERWQAFTKAKVIEVAEPHELLSAYDRFAPFADGLTVQEWVVGPETDLYSCNAYFDAKSRPLAAFVARKIRQWPPRTGTSCLGEECRNDVVLATCLRLFAEARFHGLAYLEMKRDIRTGEHLIIEPNVGRPTGRSAIAEAGGVELLMTAYSDAAGLPLPQSREQQNGGVKWIYMRNDLLSALHYWRHGELSVRDWRRSVAGPKVDAVWSRHDPVPFLADVTASASKLALGGLRRAGRRLRLKMGATEAS